MAVPQLPPELLEAVFSFLFDDQQALRACALVHRSWTMNSQSQLFEAVEVALPSEWPRLWRLLEDNNHIRPMLHHLVLHCPFPAGSSAHPGLFPLVTRLTYLGTYFETAVLDRLPALRALEFGEVETRREVIENAQAADSLALGHLERLSIRGRKSEPILSWIRRTQCSNTLRELEVAVLGGWNAHDLDTFRSVLQSLKGLQKLQLSSDIQMWWVRDAGEFIRAVYENSS
jgi:hypothetical protein